MWSYPGLEKVWEVAAHDTRVLGSALSPDGGTVGTAASDENLKVSLGQEGRATRGLGEVKRSRDGTARLTDLVLFLVRVQFWKIWDARPVSKGKGGAGGAGDEGEMAGGNRQSKSGATGGIKIR